MNQELGKLLIQDIRRTCTEVDLNPPPTLLDRGWNRVVSYVQNFCAAPKVQIEHTSVMENCSIEGGLILGENSKLINCYVAPNVDLIVDADCVVSDTVFQATTQDNQGRVCEETRHLPDVRTIHISRFSVIEGCFITGNIDFGSYTALYNTTVCTGYDPRLHIKIGESFLAKNGFLCLDNQSELKRIDDNTSVCLGTFGSHMIILNSAVLFETIECTVGDYALFAKWEDVLGLMTGTTEYVDPAYMAYKAAQQGYAVEYAPMLSAFRTGYHNGFNAAFVFARGSGCRLGDKKCIIGDHFSGIGIWRLWCPMNLTIGDNVTFFRLYKEPITIGHPNTVNNTTIGSDSCIFEDIQWCSSSGRSISCEGMRLCAGSKVDVTGRRFQLGPCGRIEINIPALTEI